MRQVQISRPNQAFAQLAFVLANMSYRLTCKSGLRLMRNLTRWLMHQAADLEHQPTLLVFGQRLMQYGASERDRMLGAEYLIKAAQQGNIEAQWLAGGIYEQGVAPFTQSDPHAVTWYARAAGQGHAQACRRLAQAYCQGELSLPANSQKASYWDQAA